MIGACRPDLILIRGLPGAGKTTLAGRLAPGRIVSADDLFCRDGTYRFVPAQIALAHTDCQRRCESALAAGLSVAVANTFAQGWEVAPYEAIAMRTGAALAIISLFDAGMTDEALAARCVHGVPIAAIRAMRARWEHDWQAHDPRPPWERR